MAETAKNFSAAGSLTIEPLGIYGDGDTVAAGLKIPSDSKTTLTMNTLLRRFAAASCARMGLAVMAADNSDGATVLQRATQAAVGDDWALARTLMLSGRADF